MYYKVLTFVFWIYLLDRTVSEPCDQPAKIGETYSIYKTYHNVSGVFEWNITDATQTNLTSMQCKQDDFCQWFSSKDPRYLLKVWSEHVPETSLYNHNVSMILGGVSPSDEGFNWIWSLNDSVIGECTLQVLAFDAKLTCMDVELHESGSEVSWSCHMKGVFPKATCLVDYENHQLNNESTSSPPTLIPTVRHTLNTNGYYDTVCTIVTSGNTLKSGHYHFNITMYPDVNQGMLYAKSQHSERFMYVNRGSETEDSNDDLLLVIGLGVGLLVVLCAIAFVLGICVEKRKCAGQPTSSTNQHDFTSMDNRIPKMADVQNAGGETENGNDNSRYQPMVLGQQQNVNKTPKQKQQKQKQRPQQEQQQQELAIYANDDASNIYANQGEIQNAMDSNLHTPGEDVYEQPSDDRLSNSANLAAKSKYDYDSPRSSETKTQNLNKTQVENKQRQGKNASPKKALLPTDAMIKPPEEYDPSEEYLEPNETALSVWNQHTGASKSNGKTTANDYPDELYEPISSQQIRSNSDDCGGGYNDHDNSENNLDDLYLEPDQVKLEMPFSRTQENNGDEYAMDDLYLNSEQAAEYYNN